MVETPSVIFEQPFIAPDAGHSFRAYLEVAADRARLSEVYERNNLSESERHSISALDGPVTLFAIVGDNCLDVITNLPIMARIADANQGISLRILYRPDHQEIAASYPGPGGRSHIPTYIIRNDNGDDLGVMVERPAVITEKMKDIAASTKAEIATKHPDIAELSKTEAGRSQIAEKFRDSFIIERFNTLYEFRTALRSEERHEIIQWVTETIGRDTQG